MPITIDAMEQCTADVLALGLDTQDDLSRFAMVTLQELQDLESCPEMDLFQVRLETFLDNLSVLDKWRLHRHTQETLVVLPENYQPLPNGNYLHSGYKWASLFPFKPRKLEKAGLAEIFNLLERAVVDSVGDYYEGVHGFISNTVDHEIPIVDVHMQDYLQLVQISAARQIIMQKTAQWAKENPRLDSRIPPLVLIDNCTGRSSR